MQRSTGKRLVFQILFALLLCLLLTVILFTELTRVRDAYFYERADLVAYTQSDTLTGYIFRDEIAPTTLNGGPINYLAQNGTAVQADQLLASVHEDDEGTNKHEQAAALYAQIAELEAALDQEDWKTAYLDSYTALMRELSTGNTAAALPCAANTATALGGRDAATDRESVSEQIERLRAELDALTAHAAAPLSTKADADGIFYHTADGYEALFGTNQIANLTPTALNDLLAAAPTLHGVIGKLVCYGPWYLAVPVDRTLAQSYVQGAEYSVCFDGVRVTMTLERLYTDNTENALLVFRGKENDAPLCAERKQTVTVEKDTTTAICIPADALSPDNTIFVSENGVARLRYVTPVLCEQGCVFLSPDDPQLAVGEHVIVSTKQLFDGKVLQ